MKAPLAQQLDQQGLNGEANATQEHIQQWQSIDAEGIHTLKESVK
jgi:hypothetical protein